MEVFITDKWNEYLIYFDDKNKDIYYYEEYVKLYENKSVKAFCIICKDFDKIILFPFLRKDIGNYYDFETPYGYGGPIANTVNYEWIDTSLKIIQKYFLKEKYICGFVRFHPLINNAVFCKNTIKIFFDRYTVVIDTSENEKKIWDEQIVSKNRNMIRKAEKNGLEYKAEYDFKSLNEFVILYNNTMNRLNAEDFYYFNNNYYRSYIEKLKGKAFLGTIRKNNELICAAIFMYSNEYGHYHLEGSNHEYSKLAANNLLLWKVALEFHNLKVKKFHLGGGFNTDLNNSLFKFKKSFSNNINDFYIGKWIFNKEKYDELKNNWCKCNPDKIDKYGNFLLCYRC